VSDLGPVTFRAAAPQDAHLIAPVHRSCWHEAYAGLVPQRCLDDLDRQDRVAHWRARLERPDHVTTIAVHEEHVVGLATVGPGDVSEELRSLYVVRRVWGGGVGRRLLHEVLGDRPASLWVFEGNDRARRFYERTGWEPTGERRRDEWTEVPELRLRRQAAPPARSRT